VNFWLLTVFHVVLFFLFFFLGVFAAIGVSPRVVGWTFTLYEKVSLFADAVIE
jgi:hypothetical protein